jgi:hypothetical protein
MDQSPRNLSGQSPKRILRGGTPFGLNPLQAPTPVEKKKQQQATKEP